MAAHRSGFGYDRYARAIECANNDEKTGRWLGLIARTGAIA